LWVPVYFENEDGTPSYIYDNYADSRWSKVISGGDNSFGDGSVNNRIYGSTPYTLAGYDIWIDPNVFKGITDNGIHINTLQIWNTYVYSKIIL